MSKYEWTTIIKQARLLKKNVEKTQKMGMNSRWAYYFAKAIKKPNTSIQKLSFEEAKNPTGDYISRDVQKADYLDMAKRLITYVETHKQMPNYVTYKGIKVLPRLVIYAFAKILVYYEDHNKTAPKYVTISSKAYTKPTETGNVVYDYWVKKFGFKPTSLDEILEYVADHFEYQYYYDDQKSNREVIDDQSGNCTDLLQMLYNLTKQLGYIIEVLHVLCSGGDGHVRGRFKHPKNTDGEWVYRDIACAASSGNPTCNWCTSGYTLLAVNPSWFFESINR